MKQRGSIITDIEVCMFELTTDARLNFFFVGNVPELRLLFPWESVTFTWSLPKEKLREGNCEEASIQFTVAYLYEEPATPDLLTAPYLLENQCIAYSEWLDYP
jgi:hypothetical protein